jgi:hypothetical protein
LLHFWYIIIALVDILVHHTIKHHQHAILFVPPIIIVHLEVLLQLHAAVIRRRQLAHLHQLIVHVSLV